MKSVNRSIPRVLSLVLVLAVLFNIAAVPASCKALDKSRNSNPFSDFSVGDCFYWCSYEDELLLWRVLDKTRHSLLLISEYGIECKKYNDWGGSVSWAHSSLEEWLNDDFYYDVFTGDSRSYLDEVYRDGCYQRVFLLNLDEVLDYFPSKSARVCTPTDHAVKSGAYRNPNTDGGWWWLSSKGTDSYHAVSVNSDGKLDYETRLDGTRGMVRPAIQIYLP